MDLRAQFIRPPLRRRFGGGRVHVDAIVILRGSLEAGIPAVHRRLQPELRGAGATYTLGWWVLWIIDDLFDYPTPEKGWSRPAASRLRVAAAKASFASRIACCELSGTCASPGG